MKNLFRFAMLALIVSMTMTMTACTSTDDDDDVDASFSITLSNTSIETITAQVVDSTSAQYPYVIGVVEKSYFEEKLGKNNAQLRIYLVAMLEEMGVDLTVVDNTYIFEGQTTLKLSDVWDLKPSNRYYVVAFAVDSDGDLLTDFVRKLSNTLTEDGAGSTPQYGTEEYPFLISDSTSLALFSRKVCNGQSMTNYYYQLTCDIDLKGCDTAQWTAIGTADEPFCGTFDGNGYMVSGLYVSSSDDYVGLFGYTEGAIIKNVGVSGVITGGEYVGGVVGYSSLSSVVSNCYNTASVSGVNYIGGIAGCNYSSEVADSYNTGDVMASANGVGGVVGSNKISSTVVRCYNTENNLSATSFIGGVVGVNNASTVSSSYNTSSIVAENGRAGGVAGYNYKSAVIENCYNTANITAGGEYTGGVTGYNYSSTVSSSYNVGEVAGSGEYVGGVAGINYLESAVENSYWLDSCATEDEFAEAKSTSEMQQDTFVELLNTDQSDEPWLRDSGSINNGYPVLSWQ